MSRCTSSACEVFRARRDLKGSSERHQDARLKGLTFMTNAMESALKIRPVFHARNDSNGVSEARLSSPDSAKKRRSLGEIMRGKDTASILKRRRKKV